MKVLILSDPSSIHTVKWVNSIHEAGIQTALFGMTDYNSSQYFDKVLIKHLHISNSIKRKRDGDYSKILYLLGLPSLISLISKFNPDLIHAHYASSYGFLGALVFFHPFVLSVWGNDVFDFPQRSIVHKQILKFTLSSADALFSTSNIMAGQTQYFTNKQITTIPFGVETDRFRPMKAQNFFGEEALVIGTVKSLEPNYGIEILIHAFKEIYFKYSELNLYLLIVGGGSLENKLKKLVNELGIENRTLFTGKIPHNKIPEYHNMMNIAVYPSLKESFGVSILESSSCGKPVIGSEVGGIPEVIKNDHTGYLFPAGNVSKLVKSIETLLIDSKLRTEMGKHGREFVMDKYNWNKNVEDMISAYEKITGKMVRN